MVPEQEILASKRASLRSVNSEGNHLANNNEELCNVELCS